MTDRETLIAMFQRQGIEYSVKEDDHPRKEGIATAPSPLVVEGGYLGFYTWFSFNVDGTLASVEAFE
jgi:hypothetical protein